MGQKQQPRLGVGVVAVLRSVAKGVGLRSGRGAASVSIGVVEVGGQDLAAAAEPLGYVAALVEGVERGAARGGGVAGDEAAGSERVDGLDGAAAVHLGDGVSAVVQVVGSCSRVGLLPRPQVAAGVTEPFGYAITNQKS